MDGRTFELEFAKFIQRFHEQIKEAFLEDAFQRREILSQTLLGKEMVEELADSIVSEFKSNIDRKTAVETIADRYVQLGIRCSEGGFQFFCDCSSFHSVETAHLAILPGEQLCRATL